MSAGPEEIASAVARLRAGLLVAFPTETVYGLGADALNAEAVARVFAAKGRPARNPLIVHVSDAAMARRVVASWPAEAEALAREFWPGPLTIVLPKAASVPTAVTGGGPTVAVRCPRHHVTLALLEAFGGPLVGPSANRSGGVSPTTAAHVRAAFAEPDVEVLDGGPCEVGIESTVVSLAGNEPVVLRPGMIGPPQIERVLGRPVRCIGAVDTSDAQVQAEAGGALAAPGMMASHYAPRTRAEMLLRGEIEARLSTERSRGRPNQRVIVLTHSSIAPLPPHAVIAMPPDAALYAARLYSALREADSQGASLILIERPEASGSAWDAIRDRLVRATAART